MKPTLILLVLLALSATSSTAQVPAQVPDFAACDRCIAARGCPSDFDNCRLNCQRSIRSDLTPDVTGATERCLEDCVRQLNVCGDVARLACASARDCL